MANLLEKQIERSVCDYAKSIGFLVYKFTSPERAAVPDRMFITPKGRCSSLSSSVRAPRSRRHRLGNTSACGPRGVTVFVGTRGEGRTAVEFQSVL